MTTADIDLLTEPLTTEELTRSIYDALATVGVTTTTWKAGAVTRTIIAVVAIILHALSVLISNIARSGFLEFAFGAWCTLVARYTYGAERQEATHASGTVLVSNTSGTDYVLNPDDLVLGASLTGKQYRNTEPVTIAAHTTDAAIVAQAYEAGAASTALGGEVDTVISNLSGLSVRNTEPLIGLDAENDAELKARSTAKLKPFSPDGPFNAYDYVARNARRANGSSIGVTRTRCVVSPGRVKMYCASATGGIAPDDVAIIDNEIQRKATPLAVTSDTYSAEALVVPITYTAWCYNTTGATEAQIKEAIGQGLAQYFAALPVGGNDIDGAGLEPSRLYAQDIAAEIGRTARNGALLRIFRVKLDTPSGDLPIALHQVAVLGAVNGTIVRVAPSKGFV